MFRKSERLFLRYILRSGQTVSIGGESNYVKIRLAAVVERRPIAAFNNGAYLRSDRLRKFGF